jgi:hypothetical protein
MKIGQNYVTSMPNGSTTEHISYYSYFLYIQSQKITAS